MSKFHLHIISFDVPFPADYGGVIDVFYKVKSLFEKGVKIHLHCFEYGRKQETELEKYCVEVHYYQRNLSIRNQFSFTPFIVKSRMSEKLNQRLLKDNFPILCEGMHTCGILLDSRFTKRQIIYRASNIEHEYYKQLALKTDNVFKKLFFQIESFRLRLWERHLIKAALLLAVNDEDKLYYLSKFKKSKVKKVFSFFDQDIISSKSTIEEDYILFHGNLSVAENMEAAMRIVLYLSPEINHKIIIAGKNPDSVLLQFIGKSSRLELIENPDEVQMKRLIANAKVHLLFTHQATGLKLKLLHSLYSGNYCIANAEMLYGTGLESFVEIANTDAEIIAKANELMQLRINHLQQIERIQSLPIAMKNEWKAQKIINLIFGQ